MKTSISGMVRNLCREMRDGERASEVLPWLTDDSGLPMTRWEAISKGLTLLDQGYRFLPLSDSGNAPHVKGGDNGQA